MRSRKTKLCPRKKKSPKKNRSVLLGRVPFEQVGCAALRWDEIKLISDRRRCGGRGSWAVLLATLAIAANEWLGEIGHTRKVKNEIYQSNTKKDDSSGKWERRTAFEENKTAQKHEEESASNPAKVEPEMHASRAYAYYLQYDDERTEEQEVKADDHRPGSAERDEIKNAEYGHQHADGHIQNVQHDLAHVSHFLQRLSFEQKN